MYVCIIRFFVYLTPTGLMFPRVIDLNSHPSVVQSVPTTVVYLVQRLDPNGK
jgi:hypothetical protein